MIVLWRASDGPRRAGFAVGRQIRGAVRRNRVRRRLREAYRGAREVAPAGVDVVVIGRASAATLALAGLIQEMRGAFEAVATQRAAHEAERGVRQPSGRALERPGARESK
jgi:ribonuclease P protein component